MIKIRVSRTTSQSNWDHVTCQLFIRAILWSSCFHVICQLVFRTSSALEVSPSRPVRWTCEKTKKRKNIKIWKSTKKKKHVLSPKDCEISFFRVLNTGACPVSASDDEECKDMGLWTTGNWSGPASSDTTSIKLLNGLLVVSWIVLSWVVLSLWVFWLELGVSGLGVIGRMWARCVWVWCFSGLDLLGWVSVGWAWVGWGCGLGVCGCVSAVCVCGAWVGFGWTGGAWIVCAWAWLYFCWVYLDWGVLGLGMFGLDTSPISTAPPVMTSSCHELNNLRTVFRTWRKKHLFPLPHGKKETFYRK